MRSPPRADDLVLVGEEGALADDAVGAVEDLVDDLEAEVAHRHRVAVGVGEADAPGRVLLLDEADPLGGATLPSARLRNGELRHAGGGYRGGGVGARWCAARIDAVRIPSP